MAAMPPPPPPPPPLVDVAAAADVEEIEAAEGLSKDALVALLKHKAADLRNLTAKVGKLEERNAKISRFNKILLEDRSSFSRFAADLLGEDGAGLFEEAAAQEAPVNTQGVHEKLALLQQELCSAKEDRNFFRQFVEMAFPGDKELAREFAKVTLESQVSFVLQKRWMELEDEHSSSLASVNALAREQALKLERSETARKEAERQLSEARERISGMHKEMDRMLKGRIQAAGAAAQTQKTPASQAEGVPDPQQAAQLQEVRRLRVELDRAYAEMEQRQSQTRALLLERDDDCERFRGRIRELEKEADSNAFIVRVAEMQAERDSGARAKEAQIEEVSRTLSETVRQLQLSDKQDRLLKDRIRELECSQSRSHVAGDYLKHVVLKYIQYTQAGDKKMHGLVPVLCTLLCFSGEERKAVES